MTERKSIDIPGYAHANPIPAASRIGNMVYTGLISGTDPVTRKVPPTLAEQSTIMFAHVKSLIEAAGGTAEHIIKVDVWLADRTQRAAINPAWLALFPDPHSRPARHSHSAELEGGRLVECSFVAVIG